MHMCDLACYDEIERAGEILPSRRGYASSGLYDDQVFIGVCSFSADGVVSNFPGETRQECVPTHPRALELQDAGVVQSTWTTFSEFEAKQEL